MTWIIDAHEDLAYNIIAHHRDYTLPVSETRRLENAKGSSNMLAGEATLGWPEYQRAQVAVVFSTLFAAPKRTQESGWEDEAVYADFEQAHKLYWQQLELYHRLNDEKSGYFRLIQNRSELEAHLHEWSRPAADTTAPSDQPAAGHPVGMVVLMEGAEGVRTPGELPEWWQAGVRFIGPAWAGTRYCGGTGEPGTLTKDGRELLSAMAEIGFCLDLSHMDPTAAMQALDFYPGQIIVSHGNPIGMLRGSTSNRHLTDEVVDGVIARGGVIGIVPYNKFLVADWSDVDGKRAVTLDVVVAHIDYICQRAGDALHVGLGTDSDGGFGRESIPAELDNIADMPKLAVLLSARGYKPADIEAIMGGNWLAQLRRVLPEK
jgi:membrane dipeptidase